MFRAGVSRSALRSLSTAQQPAFRAASASVRQQYSSKLCTAARRPKVLSVAKPLAVRAYAIGDKRAGLEKPDTKAETDMSQSKLTPDPEAVSVDSSTRPVLTEVGAEEGKQEHDTDMMAGVRNDMRTIKETFSLSEVPKEAYYVGMAGVLPYFATSLSTVYCAWEINHAAATGAGLLFSERTAELVLHILEPLQIGYGAVIISCLGTVHWGLEWAGFGGYQGYSRYMIGVTACAVAWPTILLPVEYALIAQFLAFNFLYYNDSRATKRGWAPPWYAVYRFVLTFIVGSAIVASLIGRGQISDRIGNLPGPADRIRELRNSQVASLEEEEAARRRFLASKDEEQQEEDDE
ncbi:hypothetical protein MBLNU230_g4637t1 [Neophaeotheca triangularis]